MEIKAKHDYMDLCLNRVVRKGEAIIVDKQRGEHLISIGYAEEALPSFSPRRKRAFEEYENA